MGILYGLLAALGWGTGDFVISGIARRLKPYQTMFYVQLAGIVAIGLVLLVRRDPLPSDPQLWLLALGVNVFNLVGTLLLYRALAVGTLAVVSPIAASFAVVTALLALLGGERPEAATLAGIVMVVAGVIVVSRGSGVANGSHAAQQRGVLAALGAALCYGFYFWLLSPVTDGLGIAWPVMLSRVVACLVASALLGLQGERLVALPKRLWGAVALATCLDTGAFLSYNSGIASAYVSVVTALASIFSAVTVLLAWVFLRERLAATQWAGVGAVLLGVLLVSM